MIYCATLADAMECVNNSNTVIYIEGSSSLGASGKDYVIEDLTNISIIGSGMSQPITCNNSWIKVKNVTNFTISNTMFLKCGTDRAPSIHFDGCHGITLTGFGLWSSTGLNLTNNTGDITIQESSVINCINKEGMQGGGMAIYLSGPHTLNISLTITKTSIFHNRLMLHDHIGPTKGGGIYLSLSSTTNVTVNISKVTIVSNSAILGGGMYVIFSANATGNRVTLSDAKYQFNEHNSSKLRQRSRGGGLRVVYSTHPSAGGNSLTISGSRFEGNVAMVGSGLSLVSNYVTHKHLQNIITLSDTSFDSNIGIIGMGLHAEVIDDTSQDYGGGYLVSVTIDTCHFASNYISLSLQNMVQGMGTIYTERLPLMLKNSNTFEDNFGTAVAISSTYVYFTNNSKTEFTNNRGAYGGAMALVNNGHMIVGASAKIQFQNNTGSLKGAAIYTASYGEANLPTHHEHSCFVRIIEASTTTISFVNNTILADNQHLGHQYSAIYLPSLQPCIPFGANTSIFDDKEWFFSGSNSSISVTTAASNLSTLGLNLMVTAVPGQPMKLPLHTINDEGDDVMLNTPLLGFFPKDDAVMSDGSRFISNGTVIAYKIPGITSASLKIQTLDTKYMFETIKVTFAPCPPAFQEVPEEKGVGCKCLENFHNNIKCDGNSAEVYDSYCMGYETLNNGTTYSYLYIVCPYMSFFTKESNYYRLPNNVSDLFPTLCSLMKRGGQFCSECENSSLGPMGVSVTSVDRRCVSCPPDAIRVNWLFYGLATIVPTTLLFLIITICSINLTSGSMNIYIFYCQALMLQENIIHFLSHFYVNSGVHSRYYAILFLPLSIWGLEYVGAIMPPLCLHPSLKTIHVCALDYVAALYPLCLIFITYCFIELHDRGCCLVTGIWRPFKHCFRKWHKEWNTRRSIIDVFAAFLLLSYTKFANITISLLIPNPVYDSSGNITSYRTLADSSVYYNSPEHRPFIFVALVILVFVIILPPLFLFLYPFRVCERLFGRWARWGPWLGVTAFVDTFNGSFKDGTNGTYDYRWFASFYFLVRLLAIITRILSWNIPIQRLAQVVICVMVASIVTLLQPHKNTVYNRLDVAILLVLIAVISYGAFYVMPSSYGNDNMAIEISFAFFIFLPSICLAIYTMWTMGKKILFMVKRKFKVYIAHTNAEIEPLLKEGGSLELPDRLLNPEEYHEKTI